MVFINNCIITITYNFFINIDIFEFIFICGMKYLSESINFIINNIIQSHYILFKTQIVFIIRKIVKNI